MEIWKWKYGSFSSWKSFFIFINLWFMASCICNFPCHSMFSASNSCTFYWAPTETETAWKGTRGGSWQGAAVLWICMFVPERLGRGELERLGQAERTWRWPCSESISQNILGASLSQMHLGGIWCFSYFRVNLVSSSPVCCWGLKERMTGNKEDAH